MKAKTCLFTILFGAAASAPAFGGSELDHANKAISASAAVLQEVLNTGAKGPPAGIIQKARCVGVIPNLKNAGFIVGGKFGKGVITCRLPAGGWSAPEIVKIEGGNFGLQIGAGSTDFVFAVMNQRGMDSLMADKFTLGADAGLMAGPVGSATSAQTDAALQAGIVSWSKAKGVYAGVTLNGATLRPDTDDNKALYGRNVTAQQILTGTVTPPASAQPLYNALNAFPSRG